VPKELVLSLENAFHGRGWQGPTLLGALRGVSPDRALIAPKPLKHSIWQLALHSAYWKYAVCLRITKSGVMLKGVELDSDGRPVFPRTPSNFPEPPAHPTPRGWREDVALLKSFHAALVDGVSRVTERQLDAIPPDGKSWPLRSIIAGAAAHDAYHCGQIQLLKRLVRME